MQATSTSRCTAQVQHPRSQQQRRSRVLTITRFQPAQQQGANKPAIPVRQQQQEANSDAAPAIPAPQEMQASVMLVPKETAAQNLLKQAESSGSPLNSFLVKCRLAWNLFFPPGESSAATRQLSPKELGKQRLSMILVADRCGLSPNSLVEMKRSTLAALQDCMDLEDLQDAHLRFTMTRENGVTYSMAVPILRPDPAEEAAEGEEDAEASWDEFEEFEHLSESDYTSVDELDMPAAVRVPSPAAAMAAQAYEAVVTSSSPTTTRRPHDDHRVQGEESDHSPSAALGRSDSPARVPDPEAAMDAQQQLGDASAAAAAAVTSVRPRGWGAAAVGVSGAEAAAGGSSSRATSRAASRRGQHGSRGSSPVVELPLEGTAVMTPDMLKELLVEELVHDVEELVEHMGPKAAVRAVEAGEGVLLIEPAAAAVAGGGEAAAAAAVAADILTEQLEAAVAEVQHFGEGGKGGEQAALEPAAAAVAGGAEAAAVAADVLAEQLEAAVAEVQHFGDGAKGGEQAALEPAAPAVAGGGETAADALQQEVEAAVAEVQHLEGGGKGGEAARHQGPAQQQ